MPAYELIARRDVRLQLEARRSELFPRTNKSHEEITAEEAASVVAPQSHLQSINANTANIYLRKFSSLLKGRNGLRTARIPLSHSCSLFSFTTYQIPGDRISYICAWLALVPQALCVVYTTLIWATREIEIVLMFAGQLCCEALNWGLKRYIKEERPKQMNGKGYGMPSSHAQFAFYFAGSLALFLLFRHRPSSPPSSSSNVKSTPASAALTVPHRILLSSIGLGGASLMAASRVYLNYHTPRQVLAGALAGLVCALLWFGVTGVLRGWGWVDWALDMPAARALRVRDLVITEDLVEAGWTRWEERRMVRRGAANDGKQERRKNR